MYFSSWKRFGDYNDSSESPIYCKTQLSRMGLKPKNIQDYQTHTVCYDGRAADFKFYTLSNTVEKRKVTRTTSSVVETPETLCESLYIINKSAKKSRNTAQRNYNRDNHSQARTAKKRKEELYDLKNKAMKKLIEDKVINLIGYHIQKTVNTESVWHSTCDTCTNNSTCRDKYDYDDCRLGLDRETWCDEEEIEESTYLLFYKCDPYSFHVPRDAKPEDINYLGEITELISSEQKIKCSMKYNDALALLKKYVGNYS